MPLWCDLGFVRNSRGNKAAANLRPMTTRRSASRRSDCASGRSPSPRRRRRSSGAGVLTGENTGTDRVQVAPAEGESVAEGAVNSEINGRSHIQNRFRNASRNVLKHRNLRNVLGFFAVLVTTLITILRLKPTAIYLHNLYVEQDHVLR